MDVRALIDHGPMTGLQIRAIGVCLLLNMLDGVDVLSLSFAAPLLADNWNIPPETLGAVFSAALIGMLLGSLLLAPLGDSIGRRKLLVISLLLIAFGMLATPFSTSVLQLIGLRLITGAGLGGVVATMATIAAEFSPLRRRNFAVTLVQGGYPLGATLTGLIAAVIIPAFGWGSVFLLGGALTLLFLPLVLFFLPESLEFLLTKQPSGALAAANESLRKMRLGELEALPPREAVVHAGRLGTLAGALREILSAQYRSATLLLWLAFFLCFVTLYFLLNWVPQLAAATGLPLELAIYAGTALNFGAFAGMAVCGYLGDRFGLRRIITVYLAAGTVVMAVFGRFQSPWAVLTALGALGMMQGGFIGLYAVAARLYPTRIRSTGVGWAIAAGRPGGIVGPIAAGFLVAAGFSMAQSFAVFAVPLALATVAVAMIRAPRLDTTRDAARAADARS
jgi:AAHS family 4-hydroxybenzoate transporter-like MFS transporter